MSDADIFDSHDPALAAAMRANFIAGQERMRERCARVADACSRERAEQAARIRDTHGANEPRAVWAGLKGTEAERIAAALRALPAETPDDPRRA